MEFEKYISIDNLRVYNLQEAIVASGFPMRTDFTPEGFEEDIIYFDEKHTRRSTKLTSCKPSTGHDCHSKAIMLSFNLTLPQYMWQQIKRYHFFDIASSCSTMHRITKMDLDVAFTPNVAAPTISMMRELVDIYNRYDDMSDNKIIDALDRIHEAYGIDVYCKSELFHAIIENIPSGLKLTAHCVTNYLQLKTMILQREHHKLPEWRYFCEYMLNNCPMLRELLNKQN